MSRETVLPEVYKPGRYIGQEWNIPQNDFQKSEIKCALCFPDLYEVGMSNLGMRILYGIVNSLEGVSCERVFACGLDMEAVLRRQRVLLFSLETQRPLREFDIVGFSLSYELSYPTVLNMLDLGGIPLRVSERKANDPLVIGGGPCVMNPEPMHEFFDLFVFGEAEEAMVEIVSLYRRYGNDFREGKLARENSWLYVRVFVGCTCLRYMTSSILKMGRWLKELPGGRIYLSE